MSLQLTLRISLLKMEEKKCKYDPDELLKLMKKTSQARLFWYTFFWSIFNPIIHRFNEEAKWSIRSVFPDHHDTEPDLHDRTRVLQEVGLVSPFEEDLMFDILEEPNSKVARIFVFFMSNESQRLKPGCSGARWITPSFSLHWQEAHSALILSRAHTH